MSGIAGIIHFDGQPVEPGLIEKMTSAMAHRGPDGIHHWVKGSVALGQCMLRTTPESLEEHQPLTNEDESLVLVMDGRVDNWEELRRELLGRGAVLRNRADAELVLRAYEVWGRDCLAHIDGDFALVIWDARRREAFCARDRIGNKPFNYHWNDKTFVFASELHTILALPWMSEILNEGMLAEFLANEWYSRDETFWQGIIRLVAAHRMVVDASGLRLEQYWLPDLWATLPYAKDEEYIEHYRELFGDVVRRMTRSHQPVAIEVSGGLDSSAIFAMAEHLRRQQKLPTPDILGYTLNFHDDSDANELEYSRAVSQYLDVPVAEILPAIMPLSWYRDWARIYREFPGYPNGTMAIDLRRAAHRLGCCTILSGVGGDEWLGMPWDGAYYTEELALKNWRNVLLCFRRDCSDIGVRRTLWWLCRFGVAPLLPNLVKTIFRNIQNTRKQRPSWMTRSLLDSFEERRNTKPMPSFSVQRRGQTIQIKILHGAYDALAREMEERLNARLGLERRLPFFDVRIIQFAFSTPERLRSRGNMTKWLHRQALINILPPAVIDRTTKADFMVMFRRQIDALQEELEAKLFPRCGLWVEPEKAADFLASYADGSQTGWVEWPLWSLVGCDALLNRDTGAPSAGM